MLNVKKTYINSESITKLFKTIKIELSIGNIETKEVLNSLYSNEIKN